MSRLSRLACSATAAVTAAVALATVPAPASHAESDSDPLCYTTRSSVDSPAYNGPSASRVYDWTNTSTQATQRFVKDRAIPSTLISGHYVPQGVAGWTNWGGTSTDVLLISAYHDGDGNSEPDGDSAIFAVNAATGASYGKVRIAKGHVGGIAVHNGKVYVGNDKGIRVYNPTKLRNQLIGSNDDTYLAVDRVASMSYTVSFLGTGGGKLWAGTFNETAASSVKGYTTTTAGYLTKTNQYYAPKKTQGVTVYGDKIAFATSYGRNDRGNLWIQKLGAQSLTDGNSTCFRAPSMIEGITQLNGRFYALYESGAWTYNKGLDDPDNPIYNLHSTSAASFFALYQAFTD